MSYLNLISLIGIFGLCGVAWLFSENRGVIPWRVIIGGIGLQLLLGLFVFQVPGTRDALNLFSGLLDGVFTAADAGARFVFGNNIVPLPGRDPFVAVPATNGVCPPPQVPFFEGYCGTRLGYMLAFRALPAVIFFSALMSLLYNLGVIQKITDVLAKIFYRTMGLSGAESLSGAANIFVGIEAAIAVKPYIAKMTRSEICAILACCFGTAASSTLAIYVSFLRPVFPNILGHLVSASIISIPACFVLSKILVPETEMPLTAGGIPVEEIEDKPLVAEDEAPRETVGGEPIERVSPMDAAIIGALDGVKMAVSIAAVLILIVGLVSLINQIFGGLASLKTSPVFLLQWVGQFFSVVTLQNIEGALFYPVTLLTGVPADPSRLGNCLLSIFDGNRLCVPDESWQAAVIIGRRLTETAIPPYQSLAEAAKAGLISDRTVLIVSYALSGFAHIASVGIFVGGTIALAPSRRKDISELGWKALFIGTLATLMISCVAGFYDNGAPGILGEKTPPPAVAPAPSPATPPAPPTGSPASGASPGAVPLATPSPSPR
ncbi:MAG: nucleoside transporter C-terminal domain-containing protein [Leptolyngbyaceae cyanobacterium bins.59]|nr:nucleoside transporter C-terminal domain-containing protein [Leptolyngbyaceae cyanobacterium bins.59]